MGFVLIGALLVGITLGLLGSGGSALMVPILVYLVGHETKMAIAESMAIVGAISLTGAVPMYRAGFIDNRSVVAFGLPAMAGTLLGAWLGDFSPDALQLAVFGGVTLLTAVMMLKDAFAGDTAKAANELPASEGHGPAITALPMVIFEGISVGALTGFVGVGGGFLIVPALLYLGKLPIRTAIGTSLVIIVLKSIVGFAKYQSYLLQHSLSVDWSTIGIFVAVGVLGCCVGQRINSSLDQQLLKRVFAIFLIVMGAFVLFREGPKLWNPPPAELPPAATDIDEATTYQLPPLFNGNRTLS